jgi:2-C-methyl-D-erythritol 4-phosphate cytidylyltransferase/2-C-methyl-D-erythritol 2,4-cyclodiphosphate synthase
VKTAAIIVAAGSGTRAASATGQPKQYADLGGMTVLARTLQALSGHPLIDSLVTVINPAHEDAYARTIASLPPLPKFLPSVAGGISRQESVRAGLDALRKHQPTYVLVHDAARPFVGAETISNVVHALATHDGAIAAVQLADTLKRTDRNGCITETLDRTSLWRAQTPQGFRYDALDAAHARAAAVGKTDFTDDAAVAEWAGLTVAVVPGDTANTKITTAEDLAMAQRERGQLEPRAGSGFDVHRFAPGDHVWLCGVKIAHTARLEGHSDADVGLHALTDAILGALSDGDIGQHFPPSQEAWRGAPSRVFLDDARQRVAARGGRICNVDVTLLCEAPKIGPHRAAMQAAIAEILHIDAARVGVKATTTEQLGFTGRREGIAAMASAMLLLPG